MTTRLRVPRAAVLAALVVVGSTAAGCGDTAASQPAWVATHPDTTALSFAQTAPGVCAITVRYPNDAPSAIGYLGSTYVQVSRAAHPGTAPAHPVGHSGDWSVYLLPGGDLLLVTPGDAFRYRVEASC